MRFGSVCSGIEAASVAWHPLGWQAAFFSEIDAFPRAVLAHRFPEVPLHGDFTTIGADDYGAIDLLVGGTPCQSFSVAGLRGGLDDERGNLALEYLRLADRKRPRWLVWENVPGVLSSNGGRDFGSILGGMVELGYGIAYRVLDAQFFGVAQRRRRVFAVGYLGDWRRAAAVLFERHSLQGHPAPRREKGQGAPTIPSRRSAGGGRGTDFDCDGGLIASTGDVSHCLNAGGMGRQDYETETLIAFEWQRGATQQLEVTNDFSPALIKSQTPAVAFAIQERAVSENLENGPQGKGYQPDVGYTLEARNKVQAVAFAQNQRDEVRTMDVAGALAAEPGAKQQTYVATPAVAFTTEQTPKFGTDCALTLTKQSPTGGGQIQSVMTSSAVRRLTPVECERLQGFPDGWTDIPWRGKPHAPDGRRYKALGNSMAVPCMAWIGRRIAMVDAMTFEDAA